MRIDELKESQRKKGRFLVKLENGDILRVTEGSLAPVPCTGEGGGQCERQEECSTFAFWDGLNRAISEYVDSVTLADLIKTKVEYYI